jgi:hypothetical protein
VKLPLAILFSLLLLAAQTFAVEVPMSGGPAEAESGCCESCVHCTCCMTESEGAPVSTPLPTPPVRSGGQVVFVPYAPVLFELPSVSPDNTLPRPDAPLKAIQPPPLPAELRLPDLNSPLARSQCARRRRARARVRPVQPEIQS